MSQHLLCRPSFSTGGGSLKNGSVRAKAYVKSSYPSADVGLETILPFLSASFPHEQEWLEKPSSRKIAFQTPAIPAQGVRILLDK